MRVIFEFSQTPGEFWNDFQDKEIILENSPCRFHKNDTIDFLVLGSEIAKIFSGCDCPTVESTMFEKDDEGIFQRVFLNMVV